MRTVILRSSRSSHRRNLAMDDLLGALTAHGAEVAEIHPDRIDPGSVALLEADICVLKAKSTAALRLGRRYHEAGVPTVGPYPATALCRDKLATSFVLEACGLPVPESFHVTQPSDVRALLAGGPVLLGPVRGARSAKVISVPEDVPPNLGEVELLAQRWYAPDGPGARIYRIGGRFFEMRRVPGAIGKPVAAAAADPELESLAWRCGEALGTDLYSVDIIRHKRRWWVVDVCSFPGFVGLAGAGALLAEHILAQAAAQRCLAVV